MWLSILEIGSAQLFSFTEIAPKSHIPMCERPASPMLLNGSRAGVLAFLYFSARSRCVDQQISFNMAILRSDK